MKLLIHPKQESLTSPIQHAAMSLPHIWISCFPMLKTYVIKYSKWTVIDWCKFRVEGEPATYIWPSVPTEGINKWSYTQVIKVVDHTKPVITKNNEGKIFR